jgi:hypothetical protein
MITIRYADLPEGFTAQAEQRGRRRVIYLRPGLTAEQRRLVLRRARQSARMGYGPRLPAAGVAQAVARDSIRGTLGTMGAVLRRHPVGSIVLAAGLAAVVSSYALFVTGSIRLALYTSPPLALSEGPPAVAQLPSGPRSGAGGYRVPTLPGSAPPKADPLDRHGDVLTPRTSVTEPGPVRRQQPTRGHGCHAPRQLCLHRPGQANCALRPGLPGSDCDRHGRPPGNLHRGWV